MELILGIAIVAAVILLGALISAGNERQRKAIDRLREHVVLWAMQDLRIKRERLARDVRVDDSLGWFNKIAAKACRHDLNLKVIEIFENPQAVVCSDSDGCGKVIFTLLSPAEIHAMKRVKHNQLSQYTDRNPLLALPRGATAFECSVLNNGILFDLELPLAWKGLTGKCLNEMGIMWIYVIS